MDRRIGIAVIFSTTIIAAIIIILIVIIYYRNYILPLIGVYIGLFGHVKHYFKHPEVKYFFDRSHKIFIYGYRGSGKTTLINHIITQGEVMVKSTEKFDYYKGRIYQQTDNRKNKQQKITITDYKGEKPSQALGIEISSRSYNYDTIIFLVDLFESFDKDLREEDIIDRYKTNSHKLIKNRVKLNENYLNKWIIEILYTVIFNPNLKHVRLLINKVDILEILIRSGNFKLENKSIEKFVKDLYKNLDDLLSKACKENKIEDFKVELISVKKDQNLRKVITELIK